MHLSQRTPVNFLLMNLAIADMAVATFFAPRYLFIHSITHPDGAAGLLLCKLLTSGNLAWVGASSSVVTLVSTAFERYYAVLHPLGTKGNLTENKVKVNSQTCFSKFIIKMMFFEEESIITVMKNRGRGGGGGRGRGINKPLKGGAPPPPPPPPPNQQSFRRGGTARRPSRPLPFYVPFWQTEKALLSCTF